VAIHSRIAGGCQEEQLKTMLFVSGLLKSSAAFLAGGSVGEGIRCDRREIGQQRSNKNRKRGEEPA